MGDPGYADYQDYRLQPPDIDEPDEESNRDSYDRCIHCLACSRAALRISGVTMVGADRLADALGCADCEEWCD